MREGGGDLVYSSVVVKALRGFEAELEGVLGSHQVAERCGCVGGLLLMK